MTQSVFKCPKRTHDPPVSSKKRKRIDVDSTLMTSNADSLDAHAFSSCFGCARPTYSTPSSPPHAECRSETSVHGTQTTAGAAYTYNGGLSIGECPATTTTSMPNKMKHSKASKWQREKRRKLLASDEACNVCPEVKSFSNKDNNGKRSRQYRWQRHQKRRLESSQEASNLSQCPKQNTNGDLLTDPKKVGYEYSMSEFPIDIGFWGRGVGNTLAYIHMVYITNAGYVLLLFRLPMHA
uniref:Uncharacterized protein n=1 Tax=Daucus carota subsp. sativus TaxID=79200 RepID=A0A161ZLS4_DAUCS